MSYVTKAIRYVQAGMEAGMSIEEAARKLVHTSPRFCLDLMEIVGSWPSSEAPIQAVQKAWQDKHGSG
jgi:hypothetical protein